MGTLTMPPATQALIDSGAITAKDVQDAFDAASTERVLSTTTAAERAGLLAGADLSPDQQQQVQRAWDNPAAAAVQRQAAATTAAATLLSESPTISDLAIKLRVNRSTVNRWYTAQRVIGFHDHRGRVRIPQWQIDFDRDDVVWGWDSVAPVAGAHPHTMVKSVMHTPQESLDGATPLHWLIGGGNPEPVKELIAALAVVP